MSPGHPGLILTPPKVQGPENLNNPANQKEGKSLLKQPRCSQVLTICPFPTGTGPRTTPGVCEGKWKVGPTQPPMEAWAQLGFSLGTTLAFPLSECWLSPLPQAASVVELFLGPS